MQDPRFTAMMPEPSEAMQYALFTAIMREVRQNGYPQASENIFNLIKSYDAARTQAINSLSTQLYNALMVAPAPVYIMQEPKTRLDVLYGENYRPECALRETDEDETEPAE